MPDFIHIHPTDNVAVALAPKSFMGYRRPDGLINLDEAGAELLDKVIRVASGEPTCAERKGFREISIFKADPAELAKIQSRYYGHLRVAALLGACVVGTETGAPNAAYKYDANTHSREALEAFIRGLAPVVERAEHYGVSLAIEPVWKHTVYNADRALEVIRAIQSPNLRIIFDPVNLLCPENAADREAIFADTMDKLAEHIAVVHIKDYVPDGAELKSVAAGEGEMDYRSILRFLKARKPYIQAALENTSNQNEVRSRQLIQRLYDEI